MDQQDVYNITIGAKSRPGKLSVYNGRVDLQMADGSYLIKDGVLQGKSGTSTYYVAKSSGGSPTKQLVFVDGLLIREV